MALQASLLGAREAEVAWEVASCGSILIYGAAHATVHSTGKQRRHMGHLAHCKRFQCCPACTPYLMGRRLEALEPIAAKLAKDKRLRHFMVVFTIRHRRGAVWKDLVKVLRKMQATVRRGHPWRDVVVGFIRLLESTYRDRNGHHPHEHIIVSVRAGEDFDPEEFFAWVSAVCERTAAKSDRTCAFSGKWWSEISRKRLGIATKYLGRADKMGTADVADDASNPLLEFSTSTKHQPLWCIPPRAFAEVWRTSKRVKWFGTGGVWHSKSTAKTDEELDAEREEIGEVIAHIPRSVWTSWTPEQRREIRCLVASRKLTDDAVVECIASQGGVAGPPPVHDWGKQDA
ncbi:MAG: protein rep [Acidobacteriota bacterium]|nr:protein rep [Acidobacteriota bacterium]